jgi:hypothetical protein
MEEADVVPPVGAPLQATSVAQTLDELLQA